MRKVCGWEWSIVWGVGESVCVVVLFDVCLCQLLYSVTNSVKSSVELTVTAYHSSKQSAMVSNRETSQDKNNKK